MRLRFAAPAGALALAVVAPACTKPTVLPGGDPSHTLACSGVEIDAVRGSLESQSGSAIPGSSVYQVQYPASIDFFTSVPKGASDLVNHLIAQAAKCPDQDYVVIAYSQGTMATFSAFGSIPEAVARRVKAVAWFGSPYF